MIDSTLKPAGVPCPQTLVEKLNIIFTHFNRGSTTSTWAPPTPLTPH